MSEEALSRPIGWWLKEADSLLDAAFDAALQGEGVGRRDWQVLASLAAGSKRRDDVVDSLTAFDPAGVIEDVISGLETKGWVEVLGAELRLTSSGLEKQQRLQPLVGAVRQQIATALPRDDYATLVGLLASLVAGLRGGSGHGRRTDATDT